LVATPTTTSTATASASSTTTATPSGHVIALTPGVATSVVVVLGWSSLTIDVPAGSSIAELVVATPAATDILAPSDPRLAALMGTAVDLSASDSTGQPILDVRSPIFLTISFRSPSGVNPTGAVIYTINRDGQVEQLPT